MIVRKIFVNSLPGTLVAVYLVVVALGTINVWPSPVLPKLRTASPDNPFGYPISSNEETWISSLQVLGCCVGCWLFGSLANIFGRKWVICSLGLPILISWLLMVIFPKLNVYLVCRCIMGAGVGGAFTVVVTYISEITSTRNRAVICTLMSTFNGIGDLFVYAVGPWISVNNLNIILMIFPLTFMVIGAICCAESPYFYIMENREELAKKSLIIFRSTKCDVEKEMCEIRNKIKEQKEGSIVDFVKTKAFLKSFILSNSLVIFQQLTGINCILMYSQTIFSITSASLSPSVSSIILGVMQIVSSLTCPLLTRLLDKKFMLTLSCVGMIISEGTLAIYYLLDEAQFDIDWLRFMPITSLSIFIFSYNLGVGPLCWLIAIELYPTRVKNLAFSFTVFIYFVSGFFLTKFFYTLIDIFGIGIVFFIFTGCNLVAIVYVKFFVIETRNKSLEEIQDILKN